MSKKLKYIGFLIDGHVYTFTTLQLQLLSTVLPFLGHYKHTKHNNRLISHPSVAQCGLKNMYFIFYTTQC
jgi:hypothetical protein